MPARASACKRTGPGWAAPSSAACDLAFADAPLLAGLLLGAHLIGPQAPALVQPLIEAIRLGNIVDQAAGGVLSGHFPGPVVKAATSGLAELRARTGRSDAPAVPAGLPL